MSLIQQERPKTQQQKVRINEDSNFSAYGEDKLGTMESHAKLSSIFNNKDLAKRRIMSSVGTSGKKINPLESAYYDT